MYRTTFSLAAREAPEELLPCGGWVHTCVQVTLQMCDTGRHQARTHTHCHLHYRGHSILVKSSITYFNERVIKADRNKNYWSAVLHSDLAAFS